MSEKLLFCLGSSFIKVSVWVYSFFLSLGFRFGLIFLGVSAWVSSFLGFRLSFKLAFASFRVLGWVYSVFIMGFLSLGFGLALLRLGLRPGFDRF